MVKIYRASVTGSKPTQDNPLCDPRNVILSLDVMCYLIMFVKSHGIQELFP